MKGIDLCLNLFNFKFGPYLTTLNKIYGFI